MRGIRVSLLRALLKRWSSALPSVWSAASSTKDVRLVHCRLRKNPIKVRGGRARARTAARNARGRFLPKV